MVTGYHRVPGVNRLVASRIARTELKTTLLLLLLLLLYDMDVSCHRSFLPGTSLEPAVIPTAQASSFTLIFTFIIIIIIIIISRDFATIYWFHFKVSFWNA